MTFRLPLLSVLVLLGMFVLVPSSSAGQTIGLSPGEMNLVVYRGDTLTEEIMISRQDSEGESVFHVSELTKSAAIDIGGITSVTIPDGEHFAPFRFTVSSSDLSVGQYDEVIQFLLDPPGGQVASGQQVIAGLMFQAHLSVQDRPGSNVVLSVADYPTLMKDISVRVPRVTQSSLRNGRRLHVAWDLVNAGQNPIEGVESHVVVSKDGVPVNAQTYLLSDDVPVGGAGVQSYDFDLSESFPSGKYTAEVSVGGVTKDVSFWVLQPTLRKRLVALLSGALAAVILAAFGSTLWRRRALKRRDNQP